MHNFRQTLAAGLVALLAVFCLLTPATEAKNKTATKYRKTFMKADAKADAERWDDVLKMITKLEKLAPEATLHLSLAAKAHAQSGNLDAAFEALELWVEAGWMSVKGLKDVDLIEPLHGDARYEALDRRARELGEHWKEAQRTIHRRLPIKDAETFRSAAELISKFEARRTELYGGSLIRPAVETSTKINALHDREIAAAGRYIEDHPDADDADDAALAAVLAAARYKEYWEYFDGDAAIVIDTAKSFLERFPESEFRPAIELALATATWKAYGEDDGEATLKPRASKALLLLEGLEKRFGDSAEATKSRVWRMKIAMELSAGAVTPEISDLFGAIEPTFEDDPELEAYAWAKAPHAMFQIKGPELFRATDLEGNEWNWETMKGKVVLIDFWATWCGPCVADIPHIQQAYEKYGDAGFVVVGVSLDDIDQDKFLAECDDLGVVWPQIYDGNGWDNAIARSFNIWGIPTPVLVDRDGKVVGVQEQIRGDKLAERLAELMAPGDP